MYQPGDRVTYRHTVSKADTAAFEGQQVHPVYSTFALGRDAEWCTRQFVLQMKEEAEEGIGTYLYLDHHSPALEGEEVVFTGTVERMEGHRLECRFEAYVGERLIARGRTGQKILARSKLNGLFERLKQSLSHKK
mgnify:CR=1 FL=1